MSTQIPKFEGGRVSADARIAIVAARFNGEFVDELIAGCVRRLEQLGVKGKRVEMFRVPGAFELPVTASALAKSGRFKAVICLGAVIRGETPHFEYVAGEAARGIQQVAIAETLPVIFGVLTTNDEQQARERLGGAHGHAGERAAEAAMEMIAVMEKIGC